MIFTEPFDWHAEHQKPHENVIGSNGAATITRIFEYDAWTVWVVRQPTRKGGWVSVAQKKNEGMEFVQACPKNWEIAR